ncbi:MAG: sigma-70 family RNA polymerase sigma factor [Ktedonobacteraceae bacterium]
MPDFLDVYETTHRITKRFLLARTRNREITEDVLQETYLKVWRFLESHDSPAHVSTWVHSIAKNTMIDMYRKQTKQEAGDIELLREKLEAPNLIEGYHREDEIQFVLAHIPQEFRDMLVLNRVHGFTIREIMERTGLPCSLVTYRLSQGSRYVNQYRKRYNT